jgi:hypothetical protein
MCSLSLRSADHTVSFIATISALAFCVLCASHPLWRCSPSVVEPIGLPLVLRPIISEPFWDLRTNNAKCFSDGGGIDTRQPEFGETCRAKHIQNGCTLNLLEKDHDKCKNSLSGFLYCRTPRSRITSTCCALFAPPTRCSQPVLVRPDFTRSFCGVYGS